MNRIYPSLAFFAIGLAGSLHAQGQITLKEVNPLMQQIFKQHVDKKEISPAIIRKSWTFYIDQFDPSRIYLLESETEPYLSPTQETLNQAIENYKNSNFTIFKELDALFKKAILRARQLRETEITALIAQGPRKISMNRDQDESFAANERELQNRIKQEILQFLAMQSDTKNLRTALEKYSAKMEELENPFLGLTENGEALSAQDQENQFSLRILKALSKGLDAHTNFLNSKEAFEMRVRLEKQYQGVGLELKQGDSYVFINRILPGSPAEKNGNIKINDRVLEVNGRKTAGESLDRVLEWFHNTSEPIISLELERPSENKTFQVSLVRSEIPVNEGRVKTDFVKFEDGIIGVITLPSFYRGEHKVTSEQDIRAAIKKLEAEGKLLGLILDLRDNTGGFLTEAVKVAGLFISSGVVVISKYSNGDEHYYRDFDGKIAFDGPLLILTSRETASAAEIVAQALQDYGVALVAGDEQTYGKGTIQSQTVTQSDNTKPYLKVTVGKYYTVSGETPQLRGVKSDILVPSVLNQTRLGERFLENAEKGGKISPTYNDTLQDISKEKQGWYQRYYTPFVQKKSAEWSNILPALRKKSASRILQNQDYQRFLREIIIAQAPVDQSADFQLEEAYNIVKDMVLLEKQAQKESG